MNYFQEHWQGKQGLAQSVFVNFVLLHAVLAFVAFLVIQNYAGPEVFQSEEGWFEFLITVLVGFIFGEGLILATLVLVLLVVINIWSMVGIWQSAVRLKREKPQFGVWSILAQILVIVVVLVTIDRLGSWIGFLYVQQAFMSAVGKQ
ncbi:hypothetical protein [Kiloniella sp. b19]|uniref:hypothetical protein n=1 Tax=Kiloniella sp. GXU_MW_B19 TaxID=3141326 RepID=UPI0031D97C36